ncbi:hypothetical protein niasHT_026544 [Heterodera trifolii]|uniref:Uncharacterized protein n=1 Tax=Heterodera trifolii TaxID=157864 RepID=A0ABD2KSI3_9BILA
MRSLLFLAFVALLVFQCSADESMQNDGNDEQFPPGPPPSNEMSEESNDRRKRSPFLNFLGRFKKGGRPKGEKPTGVPPTGSPPAERKKRSLSRGNAKMGGRGQKGGRGGRGPMGPPPTSPAPTE